MKAFRPLHPFNKKDGEIIMDNNNLQDNNDRLREIAKLKVD